MDGEVVGPRVRAVLQEYYLSLIELCELTGASPLDVSEELQTLAFEGLALGDGHGNWRRSGSAPAKDAAPRVPIVIVDLGNVHDCLQKLLPLADAGGVQVKAYADLHYNGFGVRPALDHRNCRVIRSLASHKNAADTKLVWDVACLCSDNPSPLQIYIITKDNGFRHLQELARELGHSVAFAEDWDSFKRAFRAPIPAAK